MHWSGSAALLGRAKTSQQEVVLFDARNGDVPVPPPGPWYKEGSGSAVEIDSDPPNCYAFLAASSGRKAFQVLNLRSSSLTELATYNSSTGLGRGLVYDPMRDRVYVFTEQAVLFFKPGTATQSCL
jgi:DNA-binding beta-propeller fold protein YncE